MIRTEFSFTFLAIDIGFSELLSAFTRLTKDTPFFSFTSRGKVLWVNVEHFPAI